MNRKPAQHTQHVINQLQAIDAPQYLSHELYWNYHEQETVEEYINQAMEPLRGSGRVPVLLTSLDPAKDNKIILEIFATRPVALASGATMLVRLCLNSKESIAPAVELIKAILKECRKNKSMPIWWPLLQGDLNITGWKKLKQALGNDWKYVNIAMNPFMDQKVLEEFKEQTVITQFFIGEAKGINHKEGIITIHQRCDLGTNKLRKTYNLFNYCKKIKDNKLNSVSIICGPSLPEWTIPQNRERLEKFLPLFKEATAFL